MPKWILSPVGGGVIFYDVVVVVVALFYSIFGPEVKAAQG